MANKVFNTTIRLRRDTISNYKKVADTFIPANGEICLVDTKHGLKAVCGDGVSTFGQLKFINELLKRGYYFENAFYEEDTHTTIIPASPDLLYLDLASMDFYVYNEEGYHRFTTKVPGATEAEPGIMKLYNSVGQNIDGTMSQKAISDELDDKIEMVMDEENKMLILDFDLY